MTKQFRITLFLLLFLLLFYSLLRAGFYFSNRDFFIEAAAAEVGWAFIHGIRFDVAALLMLNLPLCMLFNLPGYPTRWRWYRRLLLLLFLLLNSLGFLLNIADFAYFPTVQRRLLFEPYTRTIDLLNLLPGIAKRHLPLLALLIAFLLFFVWSSIACLRRLERRWGGGSGWKRESVWLVILVLLSVIGIRGGLQLKPIRQTNAFVSTNKAVGYLTLNSTYTVLRSLFQPALPSYSLLPQEEAIGLVRTELGGSKERFMDADYPFLRRYSPTGHDRRLNVVIFIMESWTAQYIGSISGGKSLTPFFDSLSSEGTLCVNFIANGQRSIEAMPSILTSVPGLFDNSLIGSQAELTRFRGLGHVLQEHGYNTSFLHGGTTGTMGFDGFARVAGFSRYVGKEDFPSFSDSVYDGAWGICDEPFFLDAARRMEGWAEPFCSVIFSLSSHDPYTIPAHRVSLFAPYRDESDIERAVRYSDFSLGQFFRRVRAAPWFNRTLFLITADHTEFSTRNNVYRAFHVPLLIYAPGIVSPRRIERAGSHADILPTLLEILELPAVHASMGRSILDSTARKFAVVKFGPLFGILRDDYFLLSGLEEDAELLRLTIPAGEQSHNLAKERPEIVGELRRLLYAYLQCVTFAVGNDRVFHP